MDSIEIEETVAAAVDDEQSRWHRERRRVGVVHITIESGHEFRVADGISDVAPELRRERGHPTHHRRRVDAIVQSREMAGAQPAYGQAHTTNPLFVHFRT